MFRRRRGINVPQNVPRHWSRVATLKSDSGTEPLAEEIPLLSDREARARRLGLYRRPHGIRRSGHQSPYAVSEVVAND